MNILKTVLVTLALTMICSATEAQVIKRLGNAANKAAEKAATQQTEKRVEEAVNKGVNAALDGSNKTNTDQQQQQQKPNAENANNPNTDATQQQAAQGSAAAAEMVYAKSDYVPGDVIIFDDDGSREKLGEFPSQWDLAQGVAEMMTINGEKAIRMGKDTYIVPLMKNMREYLPDAYTLELDFYNYESNRRGMNDAYGFYFDNKDKRRVFVIWISPGHDDKFFDVRWEWKTPDGEDRSGEQRVANSPTGKFYRMAVSFNQRALKVYFDGVRAVNVPNCAKATNFVVRSAGYGENNKFIKNIRIAQGAVPLYDRMMTDGKFITYGITFDIGKSTIKPESMGEINRIVTLMNENPELKFSVEGHTDSTGGAATNQTLSEARSQAVVDKLISMGIAADRLKAAGKGQTSPIADNGTDEGRAKNRRVEFVKI